MMRWTPFIPCHGNGWGSKKRPPLFTILCDTQSIGAIKTDVRTSLHQQWRRPTAPQPRPSCRHRRRPPLKPGRTRPPWLYVTRYAQCSAVRATPCKGPKCAPRRRNCLSLMRRKFGFIVIQTQIIYYSGNRNTDVSAISLAPQWKQRHILACLLLVRLGTDSSQSQGNFFSSVLYVRGAGTGTTYTCR